LILRGPRVSIRPVAYDDLPLLCRWWNDPTVMKEVRAEKLKPTLEQIREQAWPVWRAPSPSQYHEFIICRNNTPIGEIGYVFENVEKGIVSVDIKIGEPSLWGQGLGTEAMRVFVNYLFSQENIFHITAQPGEWNKRSIRIFEKLGFVETSREMVAANDYFDGGVGITMVIDRGHFKPLPK